MLSGRETSLNTREAPAPRDEDWMPAVHTIQGRVDGPTVAILGGVHGDEPEGILAAASLAQTIKPSTLSGRLLVVPIANPPAFHAGTRLSPLDGRNLARTFPGDPHGTPSERTADFLAERVIRQADFLIDLHSAGRHYAMPLLAGAYSGPDDIGRRSVAAALAFGAPVLWLHPVVAPGRSLSTALAAGIPCLYAECGGGDRVRRRHLDSYRSGVRRVLAHLGLLPPPQRPPPPPRLRLRSAGNVDEAIPTSHGGLLVSRVKPLDRVAAGQTLAHILDPHTASPLETIRSPHAGVVVLARRTSRVSPGDDTYLIAQPLPDPTPQS